MGKTAKTFALLLVALFLITLVLCSSPTVKAQNRTIVVPDDYRTIASAIGNASNGDTVYVKKGVYSEASLVIDKTIWLKGENRLTTQIKLNPKWIQYDNPAPFDYSKISQFDNSMDITANNVKISGFTISTTATSMGGLYLIHGNNTLITDNTIQNNSVYLMGSHEVFAQNTVKKSVECYSSTNNVIAENRVIGDIWVNNPPEYMVATHTTNVICGNTVTGGNGIAVGGDGNIVFNNKISDSTCGICTSIYASNCVLAKNQIINNDVGIKAATEGHNNTYFGNQVTANREGAYVANIWGIGENNVFYDNNFVNNNRDVNTDSIIVGTDRNWTAYHGGSFDNGERGNYWSSYNGADGNGDCFGDSPFVIDAERRDNHPLMAQFDISSVSVNLPEWATKYSSAFYPTGPATETPPPTTPAITPTSTSTATDTKSKFNDSIILSFDTFVVAIAVFGVTILAIAIFALRRHRKNTDLTK